MKQISAIGINLATTNWIVTESVNPEDYHDVLCAYQCKSTEEARIIAESMRAVFQSTDTEFNQQELFPYYVQVHGNFVVVSQEFLENYFDGQLQEADDTDATNYIVEDDGVVKLEEEKEKTSFVIIQGSKTSLTLKRKQAEDTDEINFKEEFLGAVLYSKRRKNNGAQIVEGYVFDGLFVEENELFKVLWLPAAPYQGQEMFTAYGCQNHKLAKNIEHKIKEDEKQLRAEHEALFNEVDANLAMHCQGSILLVSKEYITKIYGEPTRVSLVNNLLKQGFSDLYSSERSTIVANIYHQLDKARERKSKLGHSNASNFRFFPLPVSSSELRNQKTAPQATDYPPKELSKPHPLTASQHLQPLNTSWRFTPAPNATGMYRRVNPKTIILNSGTGFSHLPSAPTYNFMPPIRNISKTQMVHPSPVLFSPLVVQQPATHLGSAIQSPMVSYNQTDASQYTVDANPQDFRITSMISEASQSLPVNIPWNLSIFNSAEEGQPESNEDWLSFLDPSLQ